MEMFKPSMDWGNVPVPSLLWVARAWAICAVCPTAIPALSPGRIRGDDLVTDLHVTFP